MRDAIIMSTRQKLILLRPWTLINHLTLRHSPRNGFINTKATCCCGRWMKASSETSESKKGRCSCFPVSPHIAMWDTGIDNLSVANTPHNPVRFENTIGLVVERVRPEGSLGMVFHYLTCIFYTGVTCQIACDGTVLRPLMRSQPLSEKILSMSRTLEPS